ncbi:MAG: hypothetical protein R3F56_15890 [Planctomycetota bacterium]
MSIFDYLWDRPLKLTHAPRRGRRLQATLESRLAQLEIEVSELETVCKTLIAVIREAGVMTDDRVEALLKQAVENANRGNDPAGDRLERRPQM